jgi:hypothetical protein
MRYHNLAVFIKSYLNKLWTNLRQLLGVPSTLDQRKADILAEAENMTEAEKLELLAFIRSVKEGRSPRRKE